MNQRKKRTPYPGKDDRDHGPLDFFPTPPWAVRAMIAELQRIEPDHCNFYQLVWEPACGTGDMVRPLQEEFIRVIYSDIVERGYGMDLPGCITPTFDFINGHANLPRNIDWIITNPPFIRAQGFWTRAMERANVGVAFLCRLNFIESDHRYSAMFKNHPPAYIFIHTQRVPMFLGRLGASHKESSATAYAWFVWIKPLQNKFTKVHWIPPVRDELIRDGDYQNDHLDALRKDMKS